MRDALKAARKAKGLEVGEVAGILGISPSFCYKIEAGIRNPTIDLAKQMANLYGRTVDELFFSRKLDETSKGQPTTSELAG